jgi:flagellar FliL protein
MAADTTFDTPAKGKKKPRSLLFTIGGGVLLGVLSGIYLIAPRLGIGQTAHAAASATAAPAAPVSTVPRPLYTIENVVLNPAQTAGTRFLMAAVTFELATVEAQTAIKARESEVRDTVLHVLGEKTVAQLSDISQRDTIKTQIQSAVGAKLGPATVLRVYFPQFVIQ